MSKIVPVMMPQMGESLTEGTLVRWLKQVGDAVSQDEPLFEISTDKVDTDVPSPVAGRLTEQIVREGQTVSVGVPVALVSTAATDATATADAAGPPAIAKARDEPSGHFKSSHAAQLVSFGRGRADQRATQPAARAIDTTSSTAAPPGRRRPAAEVKPHGTSPSPGPWSPATLDAARRGGLSLDVLTALEGSGRGGRITKRDVERFLQNRGTAGPSASAPSSAQSFADPPAEYVYHPTVDDRIEPMSPVRRRIADHMTWSVRLSPHATAFAECDMTASAALISRDRARDAEAAPLTYTVLVAESALATLKEFAILNTSVVGNSVIYKTVVNLGIAVAIENPDELVVPVVHRASELSRVGLARTIADLVTRARQRRLTPDEVRGGTFTLTNPGIFGGTGGTPILHQPQVAILGLAAVTKRAVVINDAIAIRPMMSMSLTIDHRATDGMVAFRFLESLRRRIESVAE